MSGKSATETSETGTANDRFRIGPIWQSSMTAFGKSRCSAASYLAIRWTCDRNFCCTGTRRLRPQLRHPRTAQRTTGFRHCGHWCKAQRMAAKRPQLPMLQDALRSFLGKMRKITCRNIEIFFGGRASRKNVIAMRVPPVCCNDLFDLLMLRPQSRTTFAKLIRELFK